MCVITVNPGPNDTRRVTVVQHPDVLRRSTEVVRRHHLDLADVLADVAAFLAAAGVTNEQVVRQSEVSRRRPDTSVP